jgi:hypothetical protein
VVKQKLRSVIGQVTGKLSNDQLARVVFSVQYWDDPECPVSEFLIPPPPADTAGIERQMYGDRIRPQTQEPGGAERLRQWREKARGNLERMRRDELEAEFAGELDRMGELWLRHLSQALLFLARRTR